MNRAPAIDAFVLVLLAAAPGCGLVKCSEEQPATWPATVKSEGRFEGRISARVEGPLRGDVELVVAGRRIKREVRASGPDQVAGAIVDLEQRQAVLYRGTSAGKHYTRVPLEVYDRRVARERRPRISAADVGYGTTALAVLEPRPEEVHADREAVSLLGLQCRRLVVRRSRALETLEVEVVHCPGIRVDRELVRRVELGLPAAADGFPCLVAQHTRLAATRDGGGTRRGLIRWLVDKAGKLVSSTLRVLSVSEVPVEDAAFDPPAGFSEVSSIPALEAATEPPSYHDDD